MENDPHVTIADMRKVFCVKGAKKAFDVAGLDFAHFVQHGCKASYLKGHGYDAVVDRIVESMSTTGDNRGQ